MFLRSNIAFVLAASLITAPAFAARTHRAPTAGHSHSGKRHTAATPVAAKSHKMHGQQAIDSDRVTAIQQALIREHYLSGEPTTKWDTETQAAMTKFQSDQGWQTKLTPDSRALIKLGLGPDHSHAINATPNSNFNQLNAPANMPSTTAQGFVAASGVSN